MKKIFTVVLLAIISAGCSSTYITSAWKDSSHQPKKYNKVVILAMMSDPNGTIRQKMEQHIADDLAGYGYTSVCSCEEFSPEAFKDLSEEQSLARLKNSGVDAVLTVVLLDKRKEVHYISNEAYPANGRPESGTFYTYYRDRYAVTGGSGYYVANTRYFWESKFYDLESGKAIYSAQSSSFDPRDSEAMGHEYGKMIVRDMFSKAVIGDYRKPM